MDEAKWQLVPVEPTEEMLSAIWSLKHSNNQEITRQLYDAMLAASPAPALPESGVEAAGNRWEVFLDEAYYLLWAVRPVGVTTFGAAFHVQTHMEAEGLCATLNRLEALASPAPALPESGVEAVYRFLDNGEVIEAGDECPSDDCSRWEPVNRWAIGCKRSSIFKIIRRRALATPAPAPAPVPAPVQTWRDLDDARLQRAIDAFYEPCEGTTIDGIRNAILAWERG